MNYKEFKKYVDENNKSIANKLKDTEEELQFYVQLVKRFNDICEENEELKKQLHEANLQIQELIEQDIECPNDCSKLKELKKQLEEINEDQEIIVDFPSCEGWRGLKKELILVSSNNNKTFFKGLPNDYTGTIEVENGYIVEKEILDEEEKEYLSAVIRPFKDRIKYIKKIGWDKEFISVFLESADRMTFPYLKNSTMYKGMEIGRAYTLKELGLDE